MPARVARKPRTTGVPRAGRKTATTVSSSSAAESTPAATSATPAKSPSPEPEPYSPLQKTIASVFSQAQKTTAGHRKLVVNLRGIFDQCLSGNGSIGSTVEARQGYKVFQKEFCRFLDRVLVVKKSEVVGDRCLRFADLFLRNLVGEWP